MQKKYLTFVLPIILLGILFFAGQAFADTKLTNPLGTTDISALLGRIISAGLGIIGSLALLMFIYGGFRWLLSGGEPKAIQAGKDTMVWAVIGLVVVFVAYAAVGFIINALTNEETIKEEAQEEENVTGGICCIYPNGARGSEPTVNACEVLAGGTVCEGTGLKEAPDFNEGVQGVCCMGSNILPSYRTVTECDIDAPAEARWSNSGQCAFE